MADNNEIGTRELALFGQASNPPLQRNARSVRQQPDNPFANTGLPIDHPIHLCPSAALSRDLSPVRLAAHRETRRNTARSHRAPPFIGKRSTEAITVLGFCAQRDT
jgi:hypothetical protein